MVTQSASEQSLLAEALKSVLEGSFNNIDAIADLRCLSGGASHQTWAFDVHQHGVTTALVLRRDFATPLMPGDLGAEYTLLKGLRGAGIPVAEPLWYGAGDSPLNAPAIVVRRIDGTDLRKTLTTEIAAVERLALGHDLVALQAAIHAVDWRRVAGLAPVNAAHELARWSAIAAGSSQARPLLMAAARWLQANLPDLNSAVLIHGDFKTNNLIRDAAGNVTIIDWEMAQVGDAIADLAWTLLWTTPYDLVGGLLEREAYLEHYSSLTGTAIDAQRLLYWEIFSLFKLAGIFISGATGAGTPRPVCLQLQRAIPWLEARLARHLAFALEQAVA